MRSDLPALRVALVAAVATCAVAGIATSPLRTASAVAATAVAALFAVSFAVQAWRHHTITVALRRTSTADRVAGLPVRVAPLRTTAFVAGLARPEIFCGHDLADELTSDELRAVTLHERAHQLARDPLRATVRAALTPALRRTNAGRRWLETAAASREIAADRYAVDHGVHRGALASALLKVQPVSVAHAAAFTPALDLRLRALVDGDAAGPRTRVRWSPAVGLAVGLGACLAMLHPLHAVVGGLCC